jgi:hypothetical protein
MYRASTPQKQEVKGGSMTEVNSRLLSEANAAYLKASTQASGLFEQITHLLDKGGTPGWGEEYDRLMNELNKCDSARHEALVTIDAEHIRLTGTK